MEPKTTNARSTYVFTSRRFFRLSKWFRRAIPSVFLVAMISVSSTATAYSRLSEGGNDLYWPDGEVSFHIDSADVYENLVPDVHLAGADLERYIVWSARHWEQDTGAALSIEYSGDTTYGCEPHIVEGWSWETGDGVNSIGAADYAGGGGWAGFVVHDANPNTGEIYEFDMCLNSNFLWTVRPPVTFPPRVDLRYVVAHEFGHVIGAGHTADTIMDPNVGVTNRWAGLWGDDMDFARDVYSERSHSIYFRPLNPSAHTWGSEVAVAGSTNLPSGPAIGQNSSGQWHVGRAEMNVSRSTIRFRTTTYPGGPGSSWSSYSWSNNNETGVALAARTTDEHWAGAFPRRNKYVGCVRRVRAFRSTSLFSSLTYSDPTDLCTNFGVAVAYDQTSDKFVIAYVASGEDSGGRDVERIYVRTSHNGTGYAESTEVETPYYSDTAPQIACRKDGDCVLSFVDANSNARLDRQVAFTIDTNGLADFDTTVYSTGNWVYDASSPSVSTYGSPDRTFLILNYTSSSGTGVNVFYSGYDDGFPVIVPYWRYTGESSILPARMAHNPNRYWSNIFYTD